jgi:hypothetical protein
MIPKLALKVPRRGRIQSINNIRRTFWIEDEIVCDQRITDKNTRKRICFQKIRFDDHGKVEYRLTYYMLGIKPRAKGRWIFGQYSLMVPVKEMGFLIRGARKKKWPGI